MMNATIAIANGTSKGAAGGVNTKFSPATLQAPLIKILKRPAFQFWTAGRFGIV